MKERGILFSAPMVRALLADTKTQTRRPLREQPPAGVEAFQTYHHPKGMAHYGWNEADKSLMSWCTVCPYGAPGDRLWVRETWASLDSHKRPGARLVYRADTPDGERVRVDAPWTPAIHMFRWASRITLEVTEVRVERLQDISAVDAWREGVGNPGVAYDVADGIGMYHQLWDEINGAGAWDANPWVWAVSFRVLPSDGVSPLLPEGGA